MGGAISNRPHESLLRDQKSRDPLGEAICNRLHQHYEKSQSYYEKSHPHYEKSQSYYEKSHPHYKESHPYYEESRLHFNESQPHFKLMHECYELQIGYYEQTKVKNAPITCYYDLTTCCYNLSEQENLMMYFSLNLQD